MGLGDSYRELLTLRGLLKVYRSQFLCLRVVEGNQSNVMEEFVSLDYIEVKSLKGR